MPEPLDARAYQIAAARTLHHGPQTLTPEQVELAFNVLGLVGEAGECAEVVKHGLWHAHGLDLTQLAKELGDTAWYLAAVCTLAGLDLSEIMAANIAKLKVRYPNGFSVVDSLARVDVMP
jgi:NTP pyrophosphatase (non-canonical NTP hydrolase)